MLQRRAITTADGGSEEMEEEEKKEEEEVIFWRGHLERTCYVLGSELRIHYCV